MACASTDSGVVLLVTQSGILAGTSLTSVIRTLWLLVTLVKQVGKPVSCTGVSWRWKGWNVVSRRCHFCMAREAQQIEAGTDGTVLSACKRRYQQRPVQLVVLGTVLLPLSTSVRAAWDPEAGG